MKQFDLKLALQGHPLITRGGVEAFFIGTVTDPKGELMGVHPIVYQIKDSVIRCSVKGAWSVSATVFRCRLAIQMKSRMLV